MSFVLIEKNQCSDLDALIRYRNDREIMSQGFNEIAAAW